MKKLTTLIAMGAAVALYGCSQDSTPGGPGTALPESEKPMIGQTDNTFTLDVPMIATSIKQGEMDTVSIGIKRGTNFSQDVALSFDNIPTGVRIEPSSAGIPKTEEEVELTIHAAMDAALGDFVVKVTGQPDAGAAAMADLSITIAKGDMEPTATVDNDVTINDNAELQSEVVEAEREAEIKIMRAELDALQVKYETLKERASEATADAKAALDKKVAAAKVKLDQAEADLKEAKDAAPDRWEKIKEGFKGAGEELKSMFE
jgi:hypothetical protein